MKKKIFALAICSLFSNGLIAQSDSGTWIYATMELKKANSIKEHAPNAIKILDSKEGISAVYVDPLQLHNAHDERKHGAGYMYRFNEKDAREAINFSKKADDRILNFSISEDAYVTQCIGQVDALKIGATIQKLQSYGTRFHTRPNGILAADDLFQTWKDMVNGKNRSDITVEKFNHNISNQKSLIITIPGSETPNEIAIIGAHIDSGDYSNTNNAPGANDNASGIAVITETLRVLLNNDFKPKKTVQIMAYAAEEIGMAGSREIANLYKNQGKNVIGVATFDMTNYNGSVKDIFLVSDAQYISANLNLFFIELMEHYNAAGTHKLTYEQSYCGYPCGDHVSWAEKGYLAVYPFESAEADFYPMYHTPNDTFENMNNDATHSAKFSKLALEFVIEAAKSNNLSTTEVKNNGFSLVVDKKQLLYAFEKASLKIQSLQIIDSSTRKVIARSNLNSSGSLSLSTLANGFYIAVFKDSDGKTYSKKFLLR